MDGFEPATSSDVLQKGGGGGGGVGGGSKQPLEVYDCVSMLPPFILSVSRNIVDF